MAIPTELSHYADEADFVARFLIPLLHRLGFSVVANYHGKREFGKDLIFAEIDRFGHVVFHGLQAKYVSNIGQGEAIQSLIFDAQEAYTIAFCHPDTGAKEMIAGFYAVNGGTISDNARDNFFDKLRPQFGANCRLLDGAGLLALDAFASFSRSSLVKERLTGFILECQRNRRVIPKLAEDLTKWLGGKFPLPMMRIRTLAVSALLEQPLINDPEFVSALEEYWGNANGINSLLGTLLMPLSTVPARERTVTAVNAYMAILEEPVSTVQRFAEAYLAELGIAAPLASPE